MILPDNGKVVVFDDSQQDVQSLLRALSKEKIPFVYYQDETGDDLPTSPIENVRLIVLDLELVATNPSSHNLISPIAMRLRRVITKNNTYALIYWSTKEDRYRTELEKAFEGNLSDYKPLFKISLSKAEANANGNPANFIIAALHAEMSKFSTLNAFLFWESVVNSAGGDVTNQMTRFYKDQDGRWDQATKFLFHKLAKAYSGAVGEKNFDNLSRLKNALYTLNNSVIDIIEGKIHKMEGELFADLISTKKIDVENFDSILNKALLLTEISDQNIQPGNIYKTKDSLQASIDNEKQKLHEELQKKEKLPEHVRSQAIEATKKKFNGRISNLEAEKTHYVKQTNILINASINRELLNGRKEEVARIFSETIGVELNITPICDYAQDKTTLFRVLPGLLVKSVFKEYLIKGSAYTYLSDPVIHVFNENYLLVFDFRFLYSAPEDRFTNMKPCFRLKHQYISDIQVKLSSHVSRSGVYYVS